MNSNSKTTATKNWNYAMNNLMPFHLAFPVHDLGAARIFYTNVLGASTGREDETWIDFNLFGHQIVAHLKEDMVRGPQKVSPVDGHDVPVPHFGVVLTIEQWEALSSRLKNAGDTRWVIEPTIRFKGLPGEQATLFILDPSDNALEFKAFNDMSLLFTS